MDLLYNFFTNMLVFIYQLLGQDFGLAIIAFTILTRLATYPLTAQQMKSAKAMQELQGSKKYQDIQRKYKNDREKLAQEQMKLFQEMGVSPLGGCLPTIIQIPLILGVYGAVTRALAATPLQLLDLAKDIALPNAASLLPLHSQFLWMDLSQPERLYLGFLPNFGIPVLAVLVMITSYWQSKMMTPPSANPNDPGAQMGKMMTLYIPFLMGWLSYSFAAGLALYFFTGNIASVVQYRLTGRMRAAAKQPDKAKAQESKP